MSGLDAFAAALAACLDAPEDATALDAQIAQLFAEIDMLSPGFSARMDARVAAGGDVLDAAIEDLLAQCEALEPGSTAALLDNTDDGEA